MTLLSMLSAFLLPSTSCYAFTFITTQHSTTSLRLASEEARAGSGGYSVLRQPVQWDPNAVPQFASPLLLDEEQEAPMVLDESWFLQRTATSSPAVKPPTKSPPMEDAVAAAQPLDLIQRTLETLDYPVVLSALRRECTTVPARDLVDGAVSVPTSNPQLYASAYRPLTADSYRGLQERYAAVQEMQYLVDPVYNNLLGDAHYRNYKGYKEPLGAPPMGGMTLDLKSILAIADAGQVLEGPDILEVASILTVLEDISRWSKGLQSVEGVEFVELVKFVDCIHVNSTLQDLLDKAFDKEGRLSGTTFPQ